MARPSLTVAITWSRFESAVQEVIIESLRRLASYRNLPNGEEPMNLWLHWIFVKTHHAIANSPKGSLPFNVSFDGRSQPEPDDASGDSRLLKRPDFSWLLFNQQAPDPLLSQLKYYTECKRLGAPEAGRPFNDLYSGEGISRFTTNEHAYAKGCQTASMIGYIQTMDPDAILEEVNKSGKDRGIPSLARAANAWLTGQANRLKQAPLDRQFETTQVELAHFWIDLRGTKFDIPPGQPPESATPATLSDEIKKKKGTTRKRKQGKS